MLDKTSLQNRFYKKEKTTTEKDLHSLGFQNRHMRVMQEVDVAAHTRALEDMLLRSSGHPSGGFHSALSSESAQESKTSGVKHTWLALGT